MRAVNLIPAGQRRSGGVAVGAGRSQGAAYAVLGLLAGLAILALLYGVARHQISDRRSQLAAVQASTQRAHEAAAGLSAYTSFLALREQRVQAFTTLVDARFDWAHSFAELSRVLPRQAAINQLEGSVKTSTTGATSSSGTATSGNSVSSATPAGSVPVITLGGCATSQAAVAQTLQRLRLIDGVQSVELVSSTKASITSGGGSRSTGCRPGQAEFSVQVQYYPLPASSALGEPSTQLTSSSGGAQ
jgi:Tfp pilus assembly protein PilN